MKSPRRNEGYLKAHLGYHIAGSEVGRLRSFRLAFFCEVVHVRLAFTLSWLMKRSAWVSSQLYHDRRKGAMILLI